MSSIKILNSIGTPPFLFTYSQHPLWICYATRCVHFIVPSGRGRAFFFLSGQMYTSGSTFIKKIEPFVCHYNSVPSLVPSVPSKKQGFKITVSSLVFLVQTFGKVIDESGTTQTRNSAVLWCLLSDQIPNTLQLQFHFGFNKCIWAIFSQLSFWNF